MSTERHPEVIDLMNRLAALNLPPAHAVSPQGARNATKRLFAEYSVDDPFQGQAEVQNLLIEGPGGDLPIRLYHPDADGPVPIMVYIHGGGWVRGSPDVSDGLCHQLAMEVGCLVLSVDYRLAPEHPFPAAVEDTYAAVTWASEHADHYNGDPDRIAVGGSSAGGNLSAVVSLLARDRGFPDIAHQVLIYPVTDHAFDTQSYEEHADDPILSKQSMQWYWDHYLARDLDGRHPYASPLQARDVSGLPSATVITAGFDPLRSEGKAFAERLDEAGVSVTYENYEDMPHIFILFPELERSRECRELIVEELRDAFEGV